jgi:hypothetical protein
MHKDLAMNSKIKKIVKISALSLAGLITILIISALVLVYVIITPERLTPIVKKQLKNYIVTEVQLDQVELTIFSTFPKLSVRIENISIQNGVKGAPNDLFLKAKNIDVALNIRALLFENQVKISGITLQDAQVHAYCDHSGKANYMIMKSDPADTSSQGFDLISLDFIRFINSTISYDDDQSGIYFSAANLGGKLRDMMITDDSFQTALQLKSSDLYMGIGSDPYWNHFPLKLKMGLEYRFDSGDIHIHDLYAQNGKNIIMTHGTIKNDVPEDGFLFDLHYTIESEAIAKLITVIPPFLSSYLEGFSVDGYGKMKGKIQGAFNDYSMPLVTGTLEVDQIKAVYEEMKNIPISDGSGTLEIYLDMNQEDSTKINIKTLQFNTLKSTFAATGMVDQIFQEIRFDGTIKAKIDLPSITKEFLDSTGYNLKGLLHIDLYSRGTLTQMAEMNLDQIMMKGKMALSGFDMIGEQDTLQIRSPRMEIGFELNKPREGKKRDFLYADIQAADLHGVMGTAGNMQLSRANITLKSTDFTDSLKSLAVQCTYNIGFFEGFFNGNSGKVKSLVGSFHIDEMKKMNRNNYQIIAQAVDLQATQKDSLGISHVVADGINIHFDIIENYGVGNALLQWVPTGHITINNGVLNTYLIPETVKLPVFSFKSGNDSYEITDSRILLGKSDFSLLGTVWNLEPYLKKEGILKGDFIFKSQITDINRIMELTSSETGSEEVNQTVVPRSEGDPFLVPLNVDVVLKAEIKKALFNESEINNITGGIVIKDGKLILDDLRADLPGSKVYVTALYRTPRKNHLFIGLDYHMLDVEIEQLLGMFPDLDTIMPMLKSFKGEGEFHFVAESYMFSNYDLKRSTIRGAAAIAGQNLVLMDGETFSEIAKTLMFNKKTENRVDSIAAEFTLYKNEIDVYPFSLKMDKYRAVISGKHNLDMSFIYHISLVESPVPVKLGVDISGTLDQLNYKLTVPRYAEFFRPARQEALINEQLNLKRLIRETLLNRID